jgi:hypothetical protein
LATSSRKTTCGHSVGHFGFRGRATGRPRPFRHPFSRNRRQADAVSRTLSTLCTKRRCGDAGLGRYSPARVRRSLDRPGRRECFAPARPSWVVSEARPALCAVAAGSARRVALPELTGKTRSGEGPADLENTSACRLLGAPQPKPWSGPGSGGLGRMRPPAALRTPRRARLQRANRGAGRANGAGRHEKLAARSAAERLFCATRLACRPRPSG